MENDTLVAIPLFLFMGYVVERANIVNRLFFSLYMAARNLPGSLAIAALLTCAVFSTASGIVGAVVTLMGLLAYPAMANANYNRSFASGVICAGGTLGILIPPSIMFDCLCRHRQPVASAPLCSGRFSGPFARGSLHCICDRPCLDKPKTGAKAKSG